MFKKTCKTSFRLFFNSLKTIKLGGYIFYNSFFVYETLDCHYTTNHSFFV